MATDSAPQDRSEESAPYGELKTYTESERLEHTERLEAMREDDGDTWDLSDNDRAAIDFALQAVKLAGFALCAYCGHVGPKNTDDMVNHTLSCDRRPEARLFQMLDALKEYATHRPECSQSKPWGPLNGDSQG